MRPGFLWLAMMVMALTSCLDEPEMLNDDPVIEQYLQNNSLNGEKNEYGVYVVELSPGVDGTEVAINSIVETDLEFQLLDGTRILKRDSYTFSPATGAMLRGGLSGGVIGLEEGGRYQLVVPSNMAYGEQSGNIGNVFIESNSIISAFVDIVDIRTDQQQIQHENMLVQAYIAANSLDSAGPVAPAEAGWYKITLAQGDTASGNPAEFSQVDLAYTGTLLDGEQFDSSNNARFTLSSQGLIQGFYQGVRSMNKGEEAIFIIPSRLAYGPTGQSGIPPFAPLVFRIELIDF